MNGHWKTVLLALSGLVPLLGLASRPPEVMLLIYTVFVVVCLFRSQMAARIERLPGPVSLHLVGCFLVSGALTEFLAWTNNYLKAAPEPALFHPQLFADWIIGIGFYGGWAVAWTIALRWFRFRLWETFVITGLQGIFFEQLGAVFMAMLRQWSVNPLLSVIFGLYVFAVHGAAAGLATAPVLHRFEVAPKSRSWVRFPLVVALMVGFAFAGCWLVQRLAEVFGGLPSKRSIIEHPFW